MKSFSPFINILLFTIFFSTNSLIAKKRKATTISTAPALPQKNEIYQKAAAKLPAKTYKQLLDDIRTMRSNDVITEDGILTDSFVTFVTSETKKANLSPIFTKSLLQAGMSLHGELSNDNATALQALSNNKKQIENILTTISPSQPQPKLAGQPYSASYSAKATKDEKASSFAEAEFIQSTVEGADMTKGKQPQSQPQIPESKKPQQSIITKPSISAEEALPSSTGLKLVEKKSPLNGIADLHNFREQSAKGPIDNFYVNGSLNPEWLEKALSLVLDGAPLTSQNKTPIQGELVGTATELMREFLQKNKIDATQRSKILEDVKNQVIIFMNAQKLEDQSPIQKPSITHKTPGIQSVLPQPKKPQAEPISITSKKLIEDTEVTQSKPIWLSDNNTLITKTLEIEILNYIFKNQDATQKDTLTYFINQLPQGLKNKEDIISSMRTIIKKIFPEPEEPIAPAITPLPRTKIVSAPKVQKKLPQWINKETLQIIPGALKSAISSYFTFHTEADDEEIIKYFISQLPETSDKYPNMEAIKGEIAVIVEDYFTN